MTEVVYKMKSSARNNMEEVKVVLTDLKKRNVTCRIWSGDHTVWKSDAHEISNRLGWLTITDWLQTKLPELNALADDITGANFKHVVLLGMGGSSLGAETLYSIIGKRSTYPELIVLDSTVPSVVNDIRRRINPEETLFLVSSKSGTTVEPLSLFDYFYKIVHSSPKVSDAGNHFIAITDENTPLAEIARTHKFRHVFINPADIGGRYSVLSFFGIVPAVITGCDIGTLLKHASTMISKCRERSLDNPGAYLGAILGVNALHGQNKLTLVTTPEIKALGLWIEQLIAESTGKEGKGILPVIDEPLLEPQFYGDDRIFVYIRLKENADARTDLWIERLRQSGRATLVLDIDAPYDLGAEFFRWEFATAVAGAILKVNPFDQPNVQSAKKATEQILDRFEKTGELPSPDVISPSLDFLSHLKKSNYFALLAYVQPSSSMDKVFHDFRRRIATKYKIATTANYGPRYLHSTGQIHKGGPDNGHFLFITTKDYADIDIPGKPYSFGTLAAAQAMGDMHALKKSGLHLARIDLDSDDPDALRNVLDIIQ